MMKLRKYKKGDLALTRTAITKLREARDLFRKVGATRAADKVRRALKSAEGAERHASRIELFADLEARRG
jgi:hypothetical protein